MRIGIFLLSTITLTALFGTACSGDTTTNRNSPASPPTNASKPPSNELATTAKTPEPTTNAAPTLGPVFKAYCEAIARNDEAAVRKAYTAAAVKSLETEMKAEKETSLVRYLETEQISQCEVRNEKIEGDAGIAEIKTKGAPNGARIKFAKENGEWKLTGESVDFQSVKQTAGDGNTAK